MNTEIITGQFAQDVDAGLSAEKKFIPSKYFYDAAGDAIFQKIMRLPEYYLTASEFEIFQQQSADIIQSAALRDNVQLIELGAGDGTKTKLLLKEMMKRGIDFTYYPIDISEHALDDLKKNMKKELGEGLRMEPVVGEYFEALRSEHFSRGRQKFILFLGSTIGNFDEASGGAFLKKLGATMQAGDGLLVGFDLQKDPQVILNAYNDAAGITRSFNMNLLLRMNRELQADFDIGQFAHYPLYDPETGAAKSYLISKKRQAVYIGALDKSFHFEAGEYIYTEISRKYRRADIERYAQMARFGIKKEFRDTKNYFTDVLFSVG